MARHNVVYNFSGSKHMQFACKFSALVSKPDAVASFTMAAQSGRPEQP